MVVAFVILLLQAVHILYLRIKAHRFYVFRLNTLGLIKIEIINISTCGYLIYCVLTITDRIFREVVWAGFHDQSRQIVLFGTKFIVLLACGWYALLCSVYFTR
ncbi:hypothetical protein CROQUDRAFT_495234 [Cronartium quercuum f. sp. fusiforme G11]|uniref:Uncharacterized protein n=1 Tax=Cronartium quercuum f. sp. fusiforme G11 TaxID=708437 RepID=A0A9P6NJX8_9BASI|nr:hypothetical protein CROQUDRAFT_495234 [Cronartium quercuum f. sp. fusiforme G11]